MDWAEQSDWKDKKPFTKIIQTTTSTNTNTNTTTNTTTTSSLISGETINNNDKQPLDNSFEEFEGSEYPEDFYYDNPPCGLRERELLCPIMEEDNESTASGSIVNLANTSNNSAVIGKIIIPAESLNIHFFFSSLLFVIIKIYIIGATVL